MLWKAHCALSIADHQKPVAEIGRVAYTFGSCGSVCAKKLWPPRIDFEPMDFWDLRFFTKVSSEASWWVEDSSRRWPVDAPSK